MKKLNVNIEELILGKDDQLIHLDNSEPTRDACINMARQATHSLYIWSHNLDPFVFDTRSFIDCVRNMIANNPRAQLRAIVRDSNHLVKHGHQLVELARRVSSIVNIRTINLELCSDSDAFFIADETGLCYRKEAERFTGYANFCDRREAKILSNRFELLWEKAEPDPELKRLYI